MQRSAAEKARLVRDLNQGTQHVVVAHQVRKATVADADRARRASVDASVDRQALVELAARVTESEDQGAELYALLVRQPDDARGVLVGLLEAHHGDGGPRAVRRAVDDYARLQSPHRTALTELADVLSTAPTRDRGRRGRRR